MKFQTEIIPYERGWGADFKKYFKIGLNNFWETMLILWHLQFIKVETNLYQ